MVMGTGMQQGRGARIIAVEVIMRYESNKREELQTLQVLGGETFHAHFPANIMDRKPTIHTRRTA